MGSREIESSTRVRVILGKYIDHKTYKALCFMRVATVRKPAYTFPGGEPRIKETIASRAILIFWKEPRIWIFLRKAN
jgi:hypothetical protein